MKFNSYLPKDRSFYGTKNNKLRSYSSKGSYTVLPNPVVDPIVVNNISWQEFDYTEDPLYEDY